MNAVSVCVMITLLLRDRAVPVTHTDDGEISQKQLVLLRVLDYLDQQQVSVSADELLSEGHVLGNARQFLQRITARARLRALDPFEQLLCTAALSAAAGDTTNISVTWTRPFITSNLKPSTVYADHRLYKGFVFVDHPLGCFTIHP